MKLKRILTLCCMLTMALGMASSASAADYSFETSANPVYYGSTNYEDLYDASYNYGARKPQRITKTLKISCTAALCIMTAGLLVFQFFPDVLLGLFNPSQAFLEIGRVALRTISWSFPIAAICIALGASFQALGNGIYSTIVSLCRQLVVLLPVAYLLSLTGEVQRVWLAFPIAEVVSGTVTFICFTRIYRQKIKPLFEQA